MRIKACLLKLSNYSRYSVGSDGSIFDHLLGKTLEPYISEDGYHKITLRNDYGLRKTFSVHRLVGVLYVVNPLNKPEINHKDGNKTHNHFENLEWVTHSENLKHAWETGLMKSTSGRSEKLRKAAEGKWSGSDNPRVRKVMCVTTSEYFNSITEASAKYAVSNAQISKCCSGFRNAKSAGRHPDTNEKLIWKYAD